MFSTPLTGEASEEDPITLPDFVGEQEFELFAIRAYGWHLRPPFSNDVLIKMLQLSEYLVSQNFKQFTIDQIKARSFHFDPTELISLSHKHQTRELFKRPFERLVNTPLYELNGAQIRQMGFDTFIALTKVKESIAEHRRILACEPPIIKEHCKECTDHVQCEEDWYAVWWNGMGRFLLDGRHLLPWSEAVQRFKDMKFGEMNDGCRRKMLEEVESGTVAYARDKLAEKIAKILADKITEVDGGY